MSLNEEDTGCIHSKIVEDEGDRICLTCGQLLENIDFRAEWKGYGDNTNSRCRFVVSTVSKNGIEEIVEKSKLELSFAQKKEIEEKYKKMVGEKTLRGDTKRSIIAACVLFSLQKNQMVDQDDIRKRFAIDKKQMLEGVTCHTESFPESRSVKVDLDEIVIQTTKKVNEIFSVDISVDTVKKYFDSFSKIDRNFKHSGVKIATCSLLYFLISNLKKVSKVDFCKKMGIPEASMNKLNKSIPSLVEKVENI